MGHHTSIFVSTACLTYIEPLKERIRRYLDHGLTAIELGAGVTMDDETLAFISTMNVRTIIHNYFPPPKKPFVLNLASGNEEIRSRSLEMVFRALDLTREIGAPFYSLHAGFITDPTSFDKTSFIFPMPKSPIGVTQANERFVLMMATVLEYAKTLGVGLLIENNVCSPTQVGKLLLLKVEEFYNIFQALPMPELGILLDTGHLNITAHTLGFDRETFVDQVAPYIRGFHLHDNDGTEDSHLSVDSGSWTLNILRRPEFINLPIVVEAKFARVTDLHRHVDWLEEQLGNE